MLNIEIENMNTWPESFMSILDSSKGQLIDFRTEVERIDKVYEKDLLSRINPPRNKYATEYHERVNKLEEILLANKIICYHCSRLTCQEIEEIHQTGLKLLSKSLFENKLKNASASGHLTSQEYSLLQTSKRIKDNLFNKNGTRSGLLFFCPNRSTLQLPYHVYQLFRSWGGEAIYRGVDERTKIAEKLKTVGTPCIVKCSIPFKDATHFSSNFAERFISLYLRGSIETTDPSITFDMLIKRDLKDNEIIDIITLSNPEFEKMTRYNSWSKEYKFNP